MCFTLTVSSSLSDFSCLFFSVCFLFFLVSFFGALFASISNPFKSDSSCLMNSCLSSTPAPLARSSFPTRPDFFFFFFFASFFAFFFFFFFFFRLFSPNSSVRISVSAILGLVLPNSLSPPSSSLSRSESELIAFLGTTPFLNMILDFLFLASFLLFQ